MLAAKIKINKKAKKELQNYLDSIDKPTSDWLASNFEIMTTELRKISDNVRTIKGVNRCQHQKTSKA